MCYNITVFYGGLQLLTRPLPTGKGALIHNIAKLYYAVRSPRVRASPLNPTRRGRASP